MIASPVYVSALSESATIGLAPPLNDPLTETPRATSGRLARALLLKMVASRWPAQAARLCLKSDPFGRPFLDGPAGTLPFVSLSHSRGWIACAASAIGPLGIDIEVPRPGRNVAGIAAAAFGPLEAERATTGGESGFYRIWTLREAIGKATGLGLPLATDGVDRVHEGPDEGPWQMASGQANWFLCHRILDGPVHLSISVLLPADSTEVAIELWHPNLAKDETIPALRP